MTPTETLSEIVAALMWGPKMSSQLMEVTDSCKSSVDRYLSALHDAGVVRISGEDERKGTGRRQRIWELQVTPFALPDWNQHKEQRAAVEGEAK